MPHFFVLLEPNTTIPKHNSKGVFQVGKAPWIRVLSQVFQRVQRFKCCEAKCCSSMRFRAIVGVAVQWQLLRCRTLWLLQNSHLLKPFTAVLPFCSSHWLLHSRPQWKMLLSPSHVELFPNDKLRNGFTTVSFKKGLDRLQWGTSNRCKCFNANLFPLNLSALMVGWTLDLLSIWGGGMKIHSFGGNQGDYKSTKNPCGSTGQDPVVLEPHWFFF